MSFDVLETPREQAQKSLLDDEKHMAHWPPSLQPIAHQTTEAEPDEVTAFT